MNNLIYTTILKQGIRFLLRFLAGYLGYIGITKDEQTQFVEVSTSLFFGLFIALAVELWSYLEKKGLPVIIREALSAQPDTPIEEIVRRAKKKSKFVPNVKTLSLLILFSFVLTACPVRNNLVKAYKTSAQLGIYTEAAARAVGDLYQGKAISFETKEKLIEKLKLVASGGRKFHAEIKALAEIYRSNLPDDKISVLDILFNTEVIAPFTEILLEIGVLSKEVNQKIFLAIAVLRTAILTISNAFAGRQSSVSYQFYIKEKLHYAG